MTPEDKYQSLTTRERFRMKRRDTHFYSDLADE